MSYENGIFFIGKRHISCAYNDKGKIGEWVKPLNSKSLFLAGKQVIFAMPLWFKLITVFYFLLIFLPKLLVSYGVEIGWEGLPYYFALYYMFGTHFVFPTNLRKYHGAEHKVFSYRGVKAMYNADKIKQAAITNRYCSTNLVVVYFISVIFLTVCTLILYPFVVAIAWASYGSLLLAPLVNSQLNQPFMRVSRDYVLKISYFLQVRVTTTEPDDVHLRTAIRSYRRLALKEFPSEIREQLKPKKEAKKLAIVDITIIPIGTNEPSVSDYVADIHRVLETYKEKVNYKLTPMSTIIEGELPVLFEVIQALHEVPFAKGVQRVATNIRIDDRRDKEQTMSSKLNSVEEKLKREELNDN
jgi:uncharacterized protein (TIGR00106 family)